MRASKIIGLFLVFIFCTFSAFAENLYVRPDGGSYGAEDGSDWNNAFNGLADVAWGSGPGQLGAGDILWMAGGTYTESASIEGSGTPGNPIAFKRATAQNPECTGAVGWSAALDAQVAFTEGVKRFNPTGPRDYITIDGQVEDGIKVVVPLSTGPSIAGIDWSYPCSNWIMKHIYFKGPGTPEGIYYPGRTGAIDMTPTGNPGNSDSVLISHVKAEGFSTFFYIWNIAYATIEYSRIFNGCGSGNHPNIFYIQGEYSDYGTFRYNEVWNYNAEGVYHAGPAEGNRNGWKIYGNIFRDSQGTGRVLEVDLLKYDTGSVTNLEFYNNTIVNMWGGIVCGSGQTLTGIGRNNLYYNVKTSAWGAMMHDYNWSDGDLTADENNGLVNQTDPFADYTGEDFHLFTLSTARNAGTALDAEFAYDVNGATRGADGAWDVGAYEYTTTGMYGGRNPVKTLLPEEGVMYDLAGRRVPAGGMVSGIYVIIGREGHITAEVKVWQE